MADDDDDIGGGGPREKARNTGNEPPAIVRNFRL